MTKTAERARIATLAALVALATPQARAQTPEPAPPGGPAGHPTIEAINLDYERELAEIERKRVEALGRLALSQPKEQAVATFDACFRLAIARNLYAAAAPFAARVIRSEDPASGVAWLAHLVEIVAQADRGAFEESLKGLASAVEAKAGAKAAGLAVGTQASIVDAYYQRLIHADQIEVARRAMKLVVDHSQAPPVRDLASRRLRQLDLVGKPAPSIAGLDLDGKPFALADAKGKGEAVLVVFWATWCLPNAQQMPWIDHIQATYRAKGLRVVGINLDSAQDGSQELKSVLPAIRRYLLDYNVTWPVLLNGPGELDYASAFGVTEIPASVLIGRDGKISHLDLVGKKLEKAVAEALAKAP